MISGIFMCAGLSKRMGRQKLLLPFGGSSAVETSLENFLFSGIDEAVIVTGTDREVESRVREVLGDLGSTVGIPVKIVNNPAPERGQASSMKLGVAGASEVSKGYMFFLGDLPLVSSEISGEIISAFKENPGKIVVPVHEGRRGNPVILLGRLRRELLEQEGDFGGREIIKKYPELVKLIELDTVDHLLDLDTKEDYDKAVATAEKYRLETLKAAIHRQSGGLAAKTDLITLSGGGGKTSLMIFLSKLFVPEQRVVMTTTTKIIKPEMADYQTDFIVRREEGVDITGTYITGAKGYKKREPLLLLGDSVPGKPKYRGPEEEELKTLYDSGNFDIILAESDGSNGRPVKVHGDTEPVIPDYTDVCISLLGMSALNAPADEDTIHRFPVYREKFPDQGEKMTLDNIIEIVNHPEGLFLRTPENALRILVCNQWDLVPEEKRYSVRRELFTKVKSADMLVFTVLKGDGEVNEVLKLERNLL